MGDAGLRGEFWAHRGVITRALSHIWFHVRLRGVRSTLSDVLRRLGWTRTLVARAD
jgi:hypothetical protein